MPNNITDWSNWKSKSIHAGKNFIEDGAVDIFQWRMEKIKILFLMKEAYGGSSSLCNLLNNCGNGKRSFGKASTFPNLIKWADAIREVVRTGKTPIYDKDRPDSDIQRIAVVNVKKSDGSKKSNNQNLKMYIEQDWKLIEQQILLLKPDYIVCCGTFELIRNKIKFYKDENCRYNKVKWDKKDDTYIINFIHPTLRNLRHSVAFYALSAICQP